MYPRTIQAKVQDPSLKKSASGTLTGPLPPTLVRPITKNHQISEYTAALVSTRDYQQCSDLIFLFCRNPQAKLILLSFVLADEETHKRGQGCS